MTWSGSHMTWSGSHMTWSESHMTWSESHMTWSESDQRVIRESCDMIRGSCDRISYSKAPAEIPWWIRSPVTHTGLGPNVDLRGTQHSPASVKNSRITWHRSSPHSITISTHSYHKPYFPPLTLAWSTWTGSPGILAPSQLVLSREGGVIVLNGVGGGKRGGIIYLQDWVSGGVPQRCSVDHLVIKIIITAKCLDPSYGATHQDYRYK